MLCFVSELRRCVGIFAVMYGKRFFSSVFAIAKKRNMGQHDVPLSMSLVGFGMGTVLAKFHMYAILLVLRAVLNMLVSNASPRGPMCIR